MDEVKKVRKPRTDYGYRLGNTIRIVRDADNAYRGHRKEWFESLVAFNGKTVAEWVEARKTPDGETPRGYARFFAQDGTVAFDAPEATAEAA